MRVSLLFAAALATASVPAHADVVVITPDLASGGSVFSAIGRGFNGRITGRFGPNSNPNQPFATGSVAGTGSGAIRKDMLGRFTNGIDIGVLTTMNILHLAFALPTFDPAASRALQSISFTADRSDTRSRSDVMPNPSFDGVTFAVLAQNNRVFVHQLVQPMTQGQNVTFTAQGLVSSDFIPINVDLQRGLAGAGPDYTRPFQLGVGYFRSFTSDPGRLGNNSDVFSSVNFSNVSYRMAIGGIPEPATWAMMILGFGMIGGAMRARRPPIKRPLVPAAI